MVTLQRARWSLWPKRNNEASGAVNELDLSHRLDSSHSEGFLDESYSSKLTAKTEETDDGLLASRRFSDCGKDFALPPIIKEKEEIGEDQEVKPQKEQEEEEVTEQAERCEGEPSLESISPLKRKSVRFSTAEVREHPICLGDNPGSYRGVPISISWECCKTIIFSVNDFEERTRREIHQFRMDPLNRVLALKRMGYSGKEIKEGTAAANRIRVGRQRTKETLRLTPVFEYSELLKRAIRNFTVCRAAKRQERKLLEPYKRTSLYLYLEAAKVNSIQQDSLNDSLNFFVLKHGVQRSRSS